MTDVATPASNARSTAVPGGPIIQRMAEYALEHPEATEYSLSDEAEAQALLLAIAEQVRVMLNLGLERDRMKAGAMREIEHRYRRAVAEGWALKYIAELNSERQLAVYGLKIVVPAVLITQ